MKRIHSTHGLRVLEFPDDPELIVLYGLDAAGYELGAKERRDARSYDTIHGAREMLERWGNLFCRVLWLAPAGALPEVLELPRKSAVPLDEADVERHGCRDRR